MATSRRRGGVSAAASAAQRVAGADQPVRGRADGAGQQPRRPLPHHGGDGTVGDLPLEEREPLGEAVRLARARRASPPRSAAGAGGGRLVEARRGTAPPSRRWRRAGPGGPAPRRPSGRDWPGRASRSVGAVAAKTVRASSRASVSIVPVWRASRLRAPGPAAATIRPSTTGGPMATTPPLHGLRIIECSALGPAAITTALVDLGRRRDQGRAARRRLHPRDDVAHRRGHLPHAPAPQPGQALARARPAHRGRRRHPEGAGRRRRRRRRGHAARRAGPARRRATTTCGPSTPRSSSAPSRATA